jgi:hypothetical protein
LTRRPQGAIAGDFGPHRRLDRPLVSAAAADPPSAALSLGRRRVALGVTLIVLGVVVCA